MLSKDNFRSEKITIGSINSGNLISKSKDAYLKLLVYIKPIKCIRYIESVNIASLLTSNPFNLSINLFSLSIMKNKKMVIPITEEMLFLNGRNTNDNANKFKYNLVLF